MATAQANRKATWPERRSLTVLGMLLARRRMAGERSPVGLVWSGCVERKGRTRFASARVCPLVLMASLMVTPSLACSESSPLPGEAVVVDARAGMVDDAGLDDSARELRRVLGGRVREGEEIRQFPEGLGFTGNVEIPVNASVRDPLRVLRASDRSFLLTQGSGAFAVFVWNEQARTVEGVGIGDRLDKARKRYPGIRCDTASEPEALDVTWPVCVVRVGKRFLSFGEDPIESITVTDLPLEREILGRSEG